MEQKKLDFVGARAEEIRLQLDMIDETMDALRSDGDDVQTDPQPPPADPQTPPFDPPATIPKPVSHLIVGKGEAAPGEEATIEVLGYTSVPVQGFGAYIGCSPQLELVRHTVPEATRALLGLDIPTSIAEQSKRGGIEAFLSLMLLFIGQPRIDQDATDEEVEEEKERLARIGLVERRLPPMTVLMELRFRVPENATPGSKYPLENISWKYGRILRGPDGRGKVLRTRNEYGTSKEVAPHGIAPELVSGWIDVL